MAHLLKNLILDQKIAASRLKAKNQVLKSTYVATVGQNAIPYVYQWKDFLAKGLLWDFYINGIGEEGGMIICWRTSADGGLTWSAQNAEEGGSLSYPEDTALYTDGNYVYIAKISGGNIIKFRRGLLNLDGSITFTANVSAQVIGVPDYPYRPTIAADSSGYPYIGYTRHIGANDRPFVIKSSTNDGTWAMAAGYPRQLNATSSTAWRVKVLPRIGDDMIAIYLRTGFVYSQPYDSVTGWGAEENWGLAISSSEYFDAASDTQNGDAWLVGTLASGADRIIFVAIRHDDGSFDGDVVVDSEGTPVAFSTAICPGLCLNRVGVAEVVGYIFWLGEPTANHVFFERASMTLYLPWITEQGYTDLATALEAFQGKHLFQVIPHADNTYIMLVYGSVATGRKLYSVTFEP